MSHEGPRSTAPALPPRKPQAPALPPRPHSQLEVPTLQTPMMGKTPPPRPARDHEKIGTPESRRVRKLMEEFIKFVREMSDVFDQINNIGMTWDPTRNSKSVLSKDEHAILFGESAFWNAGGTMLNKDFKEVEKLIVAGKLVDAVNVFLNMTESDLLKYMNVIKNSVGFLTIFNQLTDRQKKKIDEEGIITSTTGVGAKPFQHFLRIPLLLKDFTKYLLDCENKHSKLFELANRSFQQSEKVKVFAQGVNKQFETQPIKLKKSHTFSTAELSSAIVAKSSQVSLPHLLEKSSKQYTPALESLSQKTGTKQTRHIVKSIKQFVTHVRKTAAKFNVISQMADDILQESSLDAGKVSAKILTQEEYSHLFGKCEKWKEITKVIEKELTSIEDLLTKEHLKQALERISASTIEQLRQYMQVMKYDVGEFKVNFDALTHPKQAQLERRAVKHSTTIDEITELAQHCWLVSEKIGEICMQMIHCQDPKIAQFALKGELQAQNSVLSEALRADLRSAPSIVCQ